MKIPVCLLILLLFSGGNVFAEGFDIYMLSLTWAPAFCHYDHPEKHQCQYLRDVDYAAGHLTVHGLWPNYLGRNAGPQHCSSTACNRSNRNSCQLDAMPPGLRETLKKYMPGVEDGLHQHEWTSHGACSPLGYDDYFQAIVTLAKQFETGPIATFIAQNAGKSVEFAELRKHFRAQFRRDDALQIACTRGDDGRYYLEEFRSCWSRDFSGQPGEPTACFNKHPKPMINCGGGKAIIIEAVQ